MGLFCGLGVVCTLFAPFVFLLCFDTASLGPMLSQTAPERKFVPWHISCRSCKNVRALLKISHFLKYIANCMHYLSKKDSSLPVVVGHGAMVLN